MIQGYFKPAGITSRPYIQALFQFPSRGPRQVAVELLVDTGADRTILGPADAHRLRLDLAALPPGVPSTGVGGRTPTSIIDAVLTLDGFSTTLVLPVMLIQPGQPGFPIPSLLGRDVLSQFALFLEQRSDRVLLLTPDEVAAFPLP
jgi:predicted aspartyl protease